MNRRAASYPAVSVVMPLYNKEREVARAIASVFGQTFRDFELLVVDDGSTDRGAQTVASLGDERMRLIRQANAGVSSARNRGVREAQSDLVAFLDADDEWAPEFLETVLRLKARFPSCTVMATSYRMRQANGSERSALLRGTPVHPWEGVLDDYFLLASLSDPPLCSSAVAVYRGALDAIGGFPLGVRSGEDLLTWARLAVAGSIAYSSYQGAVFWLPEDVRSRPGRFDDAEDLVGRELASLLVEAPPERVPGLRSYLGRWHEMRAVIALQRCRRGECLRETHRSARYCGFGKKQAAIALLACLPGVFPAVVYVWLKNIRTTTRLPG